MSSNDPRHNSPAVIPRHLVSTNSNTDDNFRESRQIVQRALNEISHLSQEKQAAIGGVSGVAAGYCFAKASKAAAFAIGASVLALVLAKQSGYVEIHFDRIRDSAQQRLNQVQQVAISRLPQATTTNFDREDVETFVDQPNKNITDVIKNFAITNVAITSSFIGGFLLGLSFG